MLRVSVCTFHENLEEDPLKDYRHAGTLASLVATSVNAAT